MAERNDTQERIAATELLQSDIRVMTTELSDAELCAEAQSIFDEIYVGVPPEYRRYSAISYMRREPDGITERHFVLPGTPGGESSSVEEMMSTVREAYDRPSLMDAGGSVVRVEQEYMYYLDRGNKTRLIQTQATSCSAVVGIKGDRVAIAHVGMSEQGEMVPVLEKLKADGFEPDSIWVTAAVGPLQTAETEENAARMEHDEDWRAWHHRYTEADYEAQGIPSDHIFAYDYEVEHSGSGDNLRTVTTGARTYVTMLTDGTVRLVADRYQFASVWDERSNRERTTAVSGSQAVIGSIVVH